MEDENMTSVKPRSGETGSKRKQSTVKTTTKTTRKKTPNKKTATKTTGVSSDVRLQMIREAAYYKAEKRGFSPGNDHQDWVEAEQEIDQLLIQG
jgi:hypothetical protein